MQQACPADKKESMVRFKRNNVGGVSIPLRFTEKQNARLNKEINLVCFVENFRRDDIKLWKKVKSGPKDLGKGVLKSVSFQCQFIKGH